MFQTAIQGLHILEKTMTGYLSKLDGAAPLMTDPLCGNFGPLQKPAICGTFESIMAF